MWWRDRRSLTEYSVTRVNRCKCRDGSNSPRDGIASLASHETRRRSSSTGSCEAGLTPATLPAEPSWGPTTGMPCVKMPPRLCALKSRVCVRARLVRWRTCVRARRRMRKTCVCAPSFLLLLSLSPPLSLPLTLYLSFAACVPRAQHHLSFLSHLSPGPSSSPSPPSPLGPWDFVLSLSPPSCLSFSTSSPLLGHGKKGGSKIHPSIPVRATDLLED